jgi:hypothetical protein
MDCKELANSSGSSRSGECAEFGNQIIFFMGASITSQYS